MSEPMAPRARGKFEVPTFPLSPPVHRGGRPKLDGSDYPSEESGRFITLDSLDRKQFVATNRVDRIHIGSC